MDIEMIAMELVGSAGESKSLAFEALHEAKAGRYEEAERLMELSKKASLKAHRVQTELICNEADGSGVEMNLLMVHAQDHLMNAILARELIQEIISLYKRVEK